MASCLDPLNIIPDALEDFVTDVFWTELALAGIYTEDTWKSIGLPQVALLFNLLGYDDEEIYAVQSNTIPLMPEAVPNSLLAAVEFGTHHELDLVQQIKSVILTGAPITATHYHDYGESTYLHGLPVGRAAHTSVDVVELQSIIEAELGDTITILQATSGIPNEREWALNWMRENDPQPVSNWEYLSVDQLQAYYAGPEGLYNYLDAFFYGFENVNIHYTADDTDTNPGNLIWNTGIWTTGNYFIVLYEDSAGKTWYWLYHQGDGTYPSLDENAAAGLYDLDLLPIVPLMKEFENCNDPAAPEYIAAEDTTSREILNIVNMDYDLLIEQLNDNPDIEHIQDAFFSFSMNVYSQTQGGLQALFLMFKNFQENAGISKSSYEANPDGASINIVRMEEQYFHSVLAFNWATSTEVSGTIAPVGEFASDVTILPNDIPAEDGSGGKVNSYMLFQYQHSAGTYTEIKVHGMFGQSVILTVPGVFKTYTIELSTDEQMRSNFSIPLSLATLEFMDYTARDTVLYESLSLTVYAVDYIHLEWYETKKFMNLVSAALKIIGFLILIFSFGYAKSVTAALWALAQQILVQYALKWALTELLTKYGDDDIAKTAIILAYLYFSGTLGGSGTDFFSAATLLELVTAVNVSIAIDTAALQDQIEDWTKTKEEKQEEIDAARDFLHSSDSLIDPFDVINVMYTSPYESPSDFYTRTVHTGNPGVATLAIIESYHDQALQLPELSANPVSSSS